MQYICSVAMSGINDFVEIARTAEELGFESIALPDSIFYMEKQSTDYPYTPDGSRLWNVDTEWVDPLIAAAAMGAVTSTLRFYTNVMKLGIGMGWAPEEFEWCGVPYPNRGRRVDEMIDVIKLVLAESGVTDYITIPWMFEGLGFDPPLEQKKDAMKRFAETYIYSGWQQ
jgi:alkanesulfonate monooxygenase SsuD/methylene tetrahydromethanopterin reductase-like flavin-dependent oxidoreductase (luciferase family)